MVSVFANLASRGWGEQHIPSMRPPPSVGFAATFPRDTGEGIPTAGAEKDPTAGAAS